MHIRTDALRCAWFMWAEVQHYVTCVFAMYACVSSQRCDFGSAFVGLHTWNVTLCAGGMCVVPC